MITIFENLRQRKDRALMLLICITLLTGCAMFAPSKPPVTLGDVIHMTQESVPPQTIIERMRDSGTVYPLTAAHLAELHDFGIDDQVLNYMQRTYIEDERRAQSREDFGEEFGEWDMWGGIW